jgi:transcription initiation factor TFIIIB Brf1 subunit/transcription initiation factor TFIIB
MSWDDVDDILFDGTQEQIDNIKCPECNNDLKLSYFPMTKSVQIICKGCHTVVRQNGVSQEPNFAKYIA